KPNKDKSYGVGNLPSSQNKRAGRTASISIPSHSSASAPLLLLLIVIVLLRYHLAVCFRMPCLIDLELTRRRAIAPQWRTPEFPATDRTRLFHVLQSTRHRVALAPPVRPG